MPEQSLFGTKRIQRILVLRAKKTQVPPLRGKEDSLQLFPIPFARCLCAVLPAR